MDLITILITVVLILGTLIPYIRYTRRKERQARERLAASKIAGLQAAQTMHPHIDAALCIGCGGCVTACPEGDVLAVISGKAMIVHGAKCVGHGLCADACPVGGITLLMAPPGRSANLPILTEHLETTVKHVYIAGELGGLGLIRNAVTQGKNVIDRIALSPERATNGYDVAIVGAGPAGLAAALAAKQKNLKYIVLEQGDVGGTILQYPRRKVVLTSPVELPIWGKVKFTEVSKEELLDLWEEIIAKTKLHIRTGEKVSDVQRRHNGLTVITPFNSYETLNVVLALGRRGTPRKLGVPGEQLSKVTYRLIDAETYQDCDVLVVGGGDSAVEAAVGLALHGTNRVTLSYRKDSFARLKERNKGHLDEQVRRKRINLVLNSNVKEILPQEIILETTEGVQRIRNNYVFIFAGGEMPFDFLKQVGVQFQAQEIESTTTA
jgi:thioredoxin reductase (NADPH)